MNRVRDVGFLSPNQIWALYMSRAHKLIRTCMGWSDHAMLRTQYAVIARPATVASLYRKGLVEGGCKEEGDLGLHPEGLHPDDQIGIKVTLKGRQALREIEAMGIGFDPDTEELIWPGVDKET